MASALTAGNSHATCEKPPPVNGIEALITDDYLDVEARVAELQPELVLGTQMERHIAKRLGVRALCGDFRAGPCAGFPGALLASDGL